MKTRLYNTPSPILHSVKRSDGTRWKQGYIRTLPHTSLYEPALWKQRRSRSLSFTEYEDIHQIRHISVLLSIMRVKLELLPQSGIVASFRQCLPCMLVRYVCHPIRDIMTYQGHLHLTSRPWLRLSWIYKAVRSMFKSCKHCDQWWDVHVYVRKSCKHDDNWNLDGIYVIIRSRRSWVFCRIFGRIT